TAARDLRAAPGMMTVREAAVALSTDEVGRFAGLLETNCDALTTAWTDAVASLLRGRLSHAELHRQIAELQKGFHSALAGGATDLESSGAGQVGAPLRDLSNTRAPQGFTATETAVSIFALKDAVLKVLDQGASPDAAT